MLGVRNKKSVPAKHMHTHTNNDVKLHFLCLLIVGSFILKNVLFEWKKLLCFFAFGVRMDAKIIVVLVSNCVLC